MVNARYDCTMFLKGELMGIGSGIPISETPFGSLIFARDLLI